VKQNTDFQPLAKIVNVGFSAILIYFKMDLVKYVQEQYAQRNDLPEFAAGDTITVYYKIKEGNKERIQFFRGVVLQRRGSGATETFTIRKMSGSVGVERIFPVHLPTIDKIEINKKGKVRRARIFYQRERTGKAARIKERRR
jgi:large subunit ribosomal protein L19